MPTIVRYTLTDNPDNIFVDHSEEAILYKNGTRNDWGSIEAKARRKADVGLLGKPQITISKNEIRVTTKNGHRFHFKYIHN